VDGAAAVKRSLAGAVKEVQRLALATKVAAAAAAAADAERNAAALRAKLAAALKARQPAAASDGAPSAARGAFSLDNRPRSLRCTRVPEMHVASSDADAVAQLRSVFAPAVLTEGPGGAAIGSVLLFATRAAAESALARGGSGWGFVWHV
jgi:hypothetical protein